MKKSFKIAAEQSAKFMGSGTLDVLATPSLVAMIENTAMLACQALISQELTSVGSFMEINHIHPTLVGKTVLVNCEVIAEMEGKRFTCHFKVEEEGKEVAYGKHKRVAVNPTLFMNKLV